MHELALARSLTELVLEVAAKHDAQRISAAVVEIGDLAGVDSQSLEFGFQVASQGTRAQGCQLLFRRAPLRVACESCAAEGEGDLERPGCPRCGGERVRVVSGRQLRLVSVDVDDGAEESEHA